MNVKPTNKYQFSSLAIQHKTVTISVIISNHLNKFFTQTASKIDKKLEKVTKKLHDYLQKPNEKIFFLGATCQNDIEDIRQNMQTDKKDKFHNN